MVEKPIQIAVYYQDITRDVEYDRDWNLPGRKFGEWAPPIPLPDEGEMPSSWKLSTIKRYIVTTYTDRISAEATAKDIIHSGLVIDVFGYLVTWKGATFFSEKEDWNTDPEATAVPTTQTRLIPPSCIREISWIDSQEEVPNAD